MPGARQTEITKGAKMFIMVKILEFCIRKINEPIMVIRIALLKKLQRSKQVDLSWEIPFTMVYVTAATHHPV